MNTNQHTYTKTEILNMLDTNDRAVERAVLAIYRRQTSDEQNSGETIHYNNVGFNGADSRFLSDISVKVLERGNHLSKKQMYWARRMVRKYAGQLVDIANSGQVPTAQPRPTTSGKLSFSFEMSELHDEMRVNPATQAHYFFVEGYGFVMFESMDEHFDSENELTHWTFETDEVQITVFND